jgi:WASH complex subunit 7
MIYPNEFLTRKMPSLLAVIAKMDSKAADFEGIRREHLRRMDEAVGQVSQELYMLVCSWMVRMENPEPKVADIGQRKGVICQILLQGILFAYRISHFVKQFLGLHADLEVPMRASYVRSLFRMTELMKAIEQTFHRRSMWVSDA